MRNYLTARELELLEVLRVKEESKYSRIEVLSDEEFDILVDGIKKDFKFSGWLPLMAINELLFWTRPEIAQMTDHPEMTRAGDWSGVRDSSKTKQWAIFYKYVYPSLRGIPQEFYPFAITYFDPEDPEGREKTWRFRTMKEAEEKRRDLAAVWKVDLIKIFITRA